MAHNADIIVVGGGATGCLAAWVLANAGMRVLLVEAGSQEIQAVATIEGEPYLQAEGTSFNWIRARGLGGRTRSWTGISLRLPSDADLGEWPIGVSDLNPYYAQVERLINVQVEPSYLDYEVQLADRAARLGVSVASLPRAVAKTGAHRVFDAQSLIADMASIEGLCVITGVQVTRVVFDGNRAVGAIGVGPLGRPWTACAKAVVLAASACESTRLLLNSLPFASPALGRHLTDTVGVKVKARFPGLGVSASSVSAPPRAYFPFGLGEARAKDHHVEFGVPRSTRERSEAMAEAPVLSFNLRASSVASDQSRCELDPNVRDRAGMPVLRFSFQRSEHDLRLIEDFLRSGTETIVRLGGTIVRTEVLSPGSLSHEAGTARLGRDPATSVLDPYCRVWNTVGLLVIDAACLPTHPHVNPTLTLLAGAWRACDQLLHELR